MNTTTDESKIYHPKRALDVLCYVLGINDMDVWKIEVTATIKDGAQVTTYHRGLRKVGHEHYEETKDWRLVRSTENGTADESQNGGS